MNRRDYQSAFSKLEPSAGWIDAALSPRQAQGRRVVHPGSVLLAAVLLTALLAGTVFAAVHFHWFSVGGAEQIIQPAHDLEAAGKDETHLPSPQGLLSLEGDSSETQIGFTLPESYLDGQDTPNCWRLENGLYRRYYRNPEPGNPGSPLLSVEIVYDANWLTRYPSELVREDEWNGMQTVWLRLDSSADGRPQYVLFQRNEELGCFAVIASTTSFEEAEQAAKDMRYADSGIPITQTEDPVFYGFRLGWTPDGWTPDSRTVMADRWYIVNATLRDEQPDLNEVLLSQSFVYLGETCCSIGVSIADHLRDVAPIAHGTVYRSETVSGRPVQWIRGSDGNTWIQIKFLEQQVQLLACVQCTRWNPETEEMDEVPAEDAFVAIAERLLDNAELIPVAIAEPAPAEFYPFSVG